MKTKCGGDFHRRLNDFQLHHNWCQKNPCFIRITRIWWTWNILDHYECASRTCANCVFAGQELAGYTGGDTSFLKEDLELQINRRLLWDSVSPSRPFSQNALNIYQDILSNLILCHWMFFLCVFFFCNKWFYVCSGPFCISVGWDTLSTGRKTVLHCWQVYLMYWCEALWSRFSQNTISYINLETQDDFIIVFSSSYLQEALHVCLHLVLSVTLACKAFLTFTWMFVNVLTIFMWKCVVFWQQCTSAVFLKVCVLFRFYLGGPTSVRGFGMYSIGPQSEGKR